MRTNHTDDGGNPEAFARAAALNGMTVEQWRAACDQYEAQAKDRKLTDRLMRSIPQYRGAAA